MTGEATPAAAPATLPPDDPRCTPTLADPSRAGL